MKIIHPFTSQITLARVGTKKPKYRKKCLPGSNFEIFRFISSLVSVKTELKPVNFNFLVPLHHAIFEFNEAN